MKDIRETFFSRLWDTDGRFVGKLVDDRNFGKVIIKVRRCGA